MIAEETSLPQGFEDLQCYAGTWGSIELQSDRYLLRQSSSMRELAAFYTATAPRLEEIFSHLEKFPMDNLPEAEGLLYRIILGLTEVGIAIEVFNQPRHPAAPLNHYVGIDVT